ARSQLIELRQTLGSQAEAFFQGSLPQISPRLPAITVTMTPKEFLTQVFAINNGLVINEGTNAVGSCQLLIKYMSTLKAQQVKTLYVQGLLKDLHQTALDEFEKTGTFSRELEKQLRTLHTRGTTLVPPRRIWANACACTTRTSASKRSRAASRMKSGWP
ncbi:hypothetical protein AO269_32110, partial [Pseudomonas putida]